MSAHGPSTTVVELLMLASRTSGRPHVAAALHGALSAPRHLRVRTRRYPARIGEEQVQVVCAGRDRRFRRLPAGLEGARLGPWVSTRFPDGLDALGADVKAAEIHRLAAGRFREAGWTVVPDLVRWRAPVQSLPPDPPSESLRSDLRKAAGFDIESVGRPDPAEWGSFEREMIVPHVRRRFGDRAWIWSGAYMAALRRRATLLFAIRDGRRVAGACVLRSGDELWMALAGVRDGDPVLLRAGALAAVYAGTFEHARRSGAAWVDAGSTTPFLDDGVARYKRKWGLAPAPDPLSPLMAVRVAPGLGGATAVLGGRPLV